MLPNQANGSNLPVVFSYGEKNKLTAIQIEDQSWVVAKDICEALSLSDVRRAVSKLDEDEKLSGEILHSGQKRRMWLVNESGLYALIMRSSKPEAKQFRKWVTSEVLPALRQTGGYGVATSEHWNQHNNELTEMVDRCIRIAGSANKLAARIGISGSALINVKRNQTLVSSQTLAMVERVCRVIEKEGMSLSSDSIDMLMQIDDKKIRLGLYQKLKGAVIC